MTSDDERTLRSHSEPLPRTSEELVSLFKRVVVLPAVDEITITTTEFSFRRWVSPGEEPLPTGRDLSGIDPEFILNRIDLVEIPLDLEKHPYDCVREAMSLITARRLKPLAIIAPEGPWLEAFFGLPEDPPTQHFLGVEVIRSPTEICVEKLVVVGGATGYLSDAVFGAIIDLGV